MAQVASGFPAYQDQAKAQFERALLRCMSCVKLPAALLRAVLGLCPSCHALLPGAPEKPHGAVSTVRAPNLLAGARGEVCLCRPSGECSEWRHRLVPWPSCSMAPSLLLFSWVNPPCLLGNGLAIGDAPLGFVQGTCIPRRESFTVCLTKRQNLAGTKRQNSREEFSSRTEVAKDSLVALHSRCFSKGSSRVKIAIH